VGTGVAGLLSVRGANMYLRGEGGVGSRCWDLGVRSCTILLLVSGNLEPN
jgi:hypothetical protein